MECLKDDPYYKGYIAGYRDGMTDAMNGKAYNSLESDVAQLSLHAMSLSARALNCLSNANCQTVADVAALSESTIATMRNMGRKTASEIANWLDKHGIHGSAWSKYIT